MIAQVVGIDPGLVHTGVVRMLFSTSAKRLIVEHEAVVGTDAVAVKSWIVDPGHITSRTDVFIEKYVPRMKLSSDERMVKFEQDLRRALPKAKLLPNMGVKRVVPQPLMEVLGVWKFPTSTHHQDLRSAARIALYGMMKDPELNGVLAATVRDHLNGRTWAVEEA
jgi:hypothetical protein